jgi:predicted transcriptional regulator
MNSARRRELYRLSDEERTAVREGMEDARNGNFATDEQIEAFYQLHRYPAPISGMASSRSNK